MILNNWLKIYAIWGLFFKRIIKVLLLCFSACICLWTAVTVTMKLCRNTQKSAYKAEMINFSWIFHRKRKQQRRTSRVQAGVQNTSQRTHAAHHVTVSQGAIQIIGGSLNSEMPMDNRLPSAPFASNSSLLRGMSIICVSTVSVLYHFLFSIVAETDDKRK